MTELLIVASTASVALVTVGPLIMTFRTQDSLQWLELLIAYDGS
uniref:Uncharacterized protein n=1 Tax=Nelumbo nucifera TaxID=4432 RepID=A0A822XY55_NELNU|nr:TPA_asm: hypothetical protein HUJ06_025604 [Nelumbo nucifera]